jgi:hypothetical protein
MHYYGEVSVRKTYKCPRKLCVVYLKTSLAFRKLLEYLSPLKIDQLENIQESIRGGISESRIDLNASPACGIMNGIFDSPACHVPPKTVKL